MTIRFRKAILAILLVSLGFTESQASIFDYLKDWFSRPVVQCITAGALLVGGAYAWYKWSTRSELGYKTFDEWAQACKKLPSNISIPYGTGATALSWQELESVLKKFMSTMEGRSAYMANMNMWIDANIAQKNLQKLFAAQKPTALPFVQKLRLPSNAIVAFHGDLHGDIHSLLTYIKTLQQKGYLDAQDAFEITNPNFYMVFLGDYTDRGNYGAEVMYTIMRLKIANPSKVFLVRGNHEDIKLTRVHGFYVEFEKKFSETIDVKQAFEKLSHMYDFLPVALYLGTGNDYIQCCHGGIEMGFDPKLLLRRSNDVAFEWLGDVGQHACNTLTNIHGKTQELSVKEQTENLQSLKEMKTRARDSLYNGFMWNDFEVNPEIKHLCCGRALKYSKFMTHAVLQLQSDNNNKIRGVFRAHQHNNPSDPMMASILDSSSGYAGVSKIWKDNNSGGKSLWDGIVCTFCVAPDTVYSGNGQHFNYDAFGILKLGNTFAHWRLDVFRNIMIKNGVLVCAY